MRDRDSIAAGAIAGLIIVLVAAAILIFHEPSMRWVENTVQGIF